MTYSTEQLGETFPACRQLLGPEKWQAVLISLPPDHDPTDFHETLRHQLAPLDLQPWFPDLAQVESAINHATSLGIKLGTIPTELCHNPTLSIIESNWSGLTNLLDQQAPRANKLLPEQEIILVWLNPISLERVARPASEEELLALKVVIEGLDKKKLALSGQISLPVLDRSIALAISRGLLLAPPSAIKRDSSLFPDDQQIPAKFLATKTFTLQWHITQTCDLHCKHCYDRSSLADLALDDAIAVLDQLYDFCQDRHVHGQITFTGGNPLLHPQFLEIYQAAAARDLMTAIAGNPTSPKTLAKICAIQKPEFFQVSLEGLVAHNNFIRGADHFQRVIDFLAHLHGADIFSMVMLTLTRDNMDQVLPLAELLRGQTDMFTFNRLSMVGEGARLMTPSRDEYEAFLHEYLAATADNPVMALKDNLINIVRHRQGQELFGGCAGFGCGAAFNFMALLPDGEIHACRKFPSPIGNIHRQGLADLYDSNTANHYRMGPTGCKGCQLNHVCRGCLAIISSQGLDISKDRDPCCFLE